MCVYLFMVCICVHVVVWVVRASLHVVGPGQEATVEASSR